MWPLGTLAFPKVPFLQLSGQLKFFRDGDSGYYAKTRSSTPKKLCVQPKYILGRSVTPIDWSIFSVLDLSGQKPSYFL